MQRQNSPCMYTWKGQKSNDCYCNCKCCTCKNRCLPTVTTGNAAGVDQNFASIINNTLSGFFGTINFIAVQYSMNPTMTSAAMAYGTEVGSPFSVNLTDLQPGTTYYYRAVVNAACGLYLGAVKSFVTRQPTPSPTVTTGEAVNVLESSATIISNTFSGISGTINYVAVQYSTNPSMASPAIAQGTIASPFSVDLLELQPDTAYYYRATVSTIIGSYFGDIKAFITPQPAPIPIVITGDAVNVLESSATIVNNNYSGISGAIDFVAVQYSTNPSMVSAATVQGIISSPFSVNLTGLQPGTTYYYRAAVSTTSVSYYGDIKSFTTPSIPAVVITGDAVNILENSATIISNTYSGISGAINFVAVQYSINSSMASAATVQGTIGSPFSVNLTGLQPNTTYYYRATVNTASGSYYGTIKSFTTPLAG